MMCGTGAYPRSQRIMAPRMPAIFFGHGNPMNAVLRNAYSEGWAAIGASLPRPRAIVSVSAHWYGPEVAVTAMPQPRTIHDFGGFPRELYECRYPAPGDPALAARVRELLAPIDVRMDGQWGLDHGTWSVLCHAFAGADVPVIQLSIDETQPARFHYDVGRRLQPLRDEGILVMGSGDIVHNLHAYAWGRQPAEPHDWALRFESFARERMLAYDHEPLIAYETLGRDAQLSVPTPDHYLPLLYVLGAAVPGEPLSFPVEGIDGGSVSMLAVRCGA
jgi:4,5-DOPA dioxygenase extradiol